MYVIKTKQGKINFTVECEWASFANSLTIDKQTQQKQIMENKFNEQNSPLAININKKFNIE